MTARRVLFAALLGFGATILGAAHATAGPASVTIASTKLPLGDASDGSHTIQASFTNLTDQTVGLKVASEPSATCAPSISPNELAPAQTTPVVVTLPKGCKVENRAAATTITAGTQSFHIIGESAAEAKPDWSALGWFRNAAILGALAVAFAYWGWASKDNRGLGSALNLPLNKQKADWSFKDSWASNITIGATVLAAFFASTDILKAVLGEEPKSALAVMTVAGALGAALVGLAPLILLASTKAGHNRVFGVLLAAIVTLTGTGGQLAVLVAESKTLNFGGAQRRIPEVGVAIALLLAIYTLRSIPAILDGGIVALRQRRQQIVRNVGAHPRLATTTGAQLADVDVETIAADLNFADVAAVEPVRSTIL